MTANNTTANNAAFLAAEIKFFNESKGFGFVKTSIGDAFLPSAENPYAATSGKGFAVVLQGRRGLECSFAPIEQVSLELGDWENGEVSVRSRAFAFEAKPSTLPSPLKEAGEALLKEREELMKEIRKKNAEYKYNIQPYNNDAEEKGWRLIEDDNE